MKPSEYRYKIEKTRNETTGSEELLTGEEFQLFADMAKHCKKESLVLDNWKIFLSSDGGTAQDYFEWWNEYKPYEQESEPVTSKSSPFDGVKKIVGIK